MTCPRLVLVAFSGPNIDRTGNPKPPSLLSRSLTRLSGYPRLQLLPMTGRDNFFHRVEKLRSFVAAQCAETIVLHTDSYDAFLRGSAARLIRVFEQLQTPVLWAAERLYSWQDEGNRTFYDRLAEGKGPYRYLNGGGYMGYAAALRPILERTVFISKFRGADQMAFSRFLANHWAQSNVSFDYGTRVFFVASGEDWNLRKARSRVLAANPCHVHVPYTAYKPNERTLLALFRDDFGDEQSRSRNWTGGRAPSHTPRSPSRTAAWP